MAGKKEYNFSSYLNFWNYETLELYKYVVI